MIRKKKNNAFHAAKPFEMIGDDLSFGAKEAYKLLRANIMFSLPDKGVGRVIGITSSLPGEGKSTTSINLASAFVEAGKRVLLIEADMRLPTFATRLGLQKAPGLSNLLVGLCTYKQAVQQSKQLNNLFVLTGGDLPPTPSELLSGEAMHTAIETLKQNFDYIILDFPPVTVVSDVIAASPILDGVIVVVREHYCKKSVLADTMRRLELTNVKQLGFVMTHADTETKRYYNKNKYGYDSYVSSYETSYAAAGKLKTDWMQQNEDSK